MLSSSGVEASLLIIIAGVIRLDPSRIEEALKAAWPHVQGGQSQSGCLDYDWSFHPQEPGCIHVFERWKNEEALEAHLTGPHYKNMLATLGRFGVTAAEVSKYRIDAQSPVYDSSGKPRADYF